MKKAKWRRTVQGDQYEMGLSVLGTVSLSTKKEGWYYWVARVIGEALPTLISPSPCGYSKTLEGGKKIVETICKESGTLDAF